MGLDRLYEWLAARRSQRLEVYRRARLTYEAYIARAQVDFRTLREEDCRAARSDPGLGAAEQDYHLATELSEQEGALRDAGVGCYQLGMLLHLQGRLEEATECLGRALQVVEALPQVGRDGRMTISGCQFHLGVIALRRGEVEEARSRLQASLDIDTALGDVAGMAMGRAALEECSKAPGEGDVSRFAGVPSPVGSQRPETPARPAEREPDRRPVERPDTTATPGHGRAAPGYAAQASEAASGEDVIWVLSHSTQASEGAMAALERCREEFPRRTVVLRVALGREGSGQTPPEVMTDAGRLCAAVLVVERQGLPDPDFRYWVRWCTTRVVTRDDFRLFVCLHGMTLEELEALSKSDDLVGDLTDTVQVSPSPSLENLHRELLPFLRALDTIRASAQWRRMRLTLMDVGGRAAHVCQILCGAALVAGVLLYHLAGADRLTGALGDAGRGPVGALVAVPLFPLLTVYALPLLLGIGAMNSHVRRNPNIARWLLAGAFLGPAAIGLPQAIGATPGWIALGIIAGAGLDVVRRNGLQARRARITLDRMLAAVKPEVPVSLYARLVAKPFSPLTCPLFPAPEPDVFISYARRSAWSSELASELHDALRANNVKVFLDRTSIPAGTSWRRALNERISDANVFVSLLDVDEKSLKRPYVAAELLAALLGRHHTHVPDILLLTHPGLTEEHLDEAVPVFQAACTQAGEDEADTTPRRVALTPESLKVVVAGLRPNTYETPSVVPGKLAAPLGLLSVPLVALGSICALAGTVALPFPLLEHWHKFELGGLLASWGVLTGAYVLAGYWLGFALRLTAASRYGVPHEDPRRLAVAHLAGAIGLAGLLAVWWPDVPVLPRAWAGVLVLLGGLLAGGFVRRLPSREDPRQRDL